MYSALTVSANAQTIAWCLIAFFGTLIVLNSIKIMGPTDGIELFLFGEHRTTFNPRKFKESLNLEQQAKYVAAEIKTAPLLDIVIGLWPFWRLVRYPTSPTKSQLHASGIFTKGTKEFPRVKVHAKPSFAVRFLTIRNAILGAGVLRTNDLTTLCPIKGDQIEYEDTRLALGLREASKELFRESLRQSAAQFVWTNGATHGSEKELASSKRIWELLTLYGMAAPESVMAQSKILKRPAKITVLPEVDHAQFMVQLASCEVKDFLGDDVLTIDINISELDLAPEVTGASEAQRAVNNHYVGIQTAAASQAIGFAEAEVEKKKGMNKADVTERQGAADASAATALQNSLKGADPGAVAALLLLKNQQVTFIPVGGSLSEILHNLGGKKP